MNNVRTHYLPNEQMKVRMKHKREIYRKKIKETSLSPNSMSFQENLEPMVVFNYVCTGKLTLVPAFIFFLGFGAGYLLFFGDSKSTPQIDNNESRLKYLSFALTGVVLSFAALILFVSLVMWLVLRLSFTITKSHFRIVKSGIFRSSLLEFNPSVTTLHYFQTHFSDSRAWLQLVVKEKDTYFTIFSWKGSGQQRNRFLNLFKTLDMELQKVQREIYVPVERIDAKIISNEEAVLLSPFLSELKQLDPYSFDDFSDVYRSASTTSLATPFSSPKSMEDIPVTSFDNFFEHFTHNKLLS
eukprot:TRINITY_DN4530_c0_g1_i1.p1 TRINITY_DN4530_c0_g1~~TRINITY_DN4530_c0_g1_i1.p1  ORF type:complete len:298 (+),score=50.27 TRINITY_DN4530_c0_g1_i1:167-1060(+)